MAVHYLKWNAYAKCSSQIAINLWLSELRLAAQLNWSHLWQQSRPTLVDLVLGAAALRVALQGRQGWGCHRDVGPLHLSDRSYHPIPNCFPKPLPATKETVEYEVALVQQGFENMGPGGSGRSLGWVEHWELRGVRGSWLENVTFAGGFSKICGKNLIYYIIEHLHPLNTQIISIKNQLLSNDENVVCFAN